MTDRAGNPHGLRSITDDMLPAPAADGIDFERGMRFVDPLGILIVFACTATFCCHVLGGGLESEEALVASGALVRDGLWRGEVRRMVRVRDQRIGFVMAVWSAWQRAPGFTDPFVANLAHLGGLSAGGLLGWFALPQVAFRRPTRVDAAASRRPCR